MPAIWHPLNFVYIGSIFEVPPPGLGEDTRVVFEELDFDED